MSTSSPSTPSTPTTAAPATGQPTSHLQHLDLQSPPQSQDNTPYLDRTTFIAAAQASQATEKERKGSLGETQRERLLPAWETKRGLEDIAQAEDRLVDKGFSARKDFKPFSQSKGH